MSIENNYTYHANLGPLSLKCHSNYSEDIQRLDTVLECLNKSDAELNSLDIISRSITMGKVKLARLINFIRTGVWMNDAGARKIVKHYTKLNDQEKQPDQAEKVKVIFDRLAQIKRGNGTYADGINPQHIPPQAIISMEKVIDFAKGVFKQLVEDPVIQEAVKLAGEKAMDTTVSVLKDITLNCLSKSVRIAADILIKNHVQATARQRASLKLTN